MNKTLFAPESTTTTLFAVVGNPWGPFALLLAVINLAAVVLCGVYKGKA